MEHSLMSRERLKQVLDLELFEDYLNKLNEETHIALTLLDKDNEVIFASPRIELCNNFMQRDQRMELICMETCSGVGRYGSDLLFCPNGLMMYRFPIRIKNEITAYLIVSQFLTEQPELECFRNMLFKNGLEKGAISNMLKDVPIIKVDKIEEIIAFIDRFS